MHKKHQDQEAASHTALVRKQRETNVPAQVTFPFTWAGTPGRGMVLPTFRMGVYSLMKLFWKCLQKPMDAFINRDSKSRQVDKEIINCNDLLNSISCIWESVPLSANNLNVS